MPGQSISEAAWLINDQVCASTDGTNSKKKDHPFYHVKAISEDWREVSYILSLLEFHKLSFSNYHSKFFIKKQQTFTKRLKS